MAKGTVNKVIILGRLGQDPEVRATAGGMQIATLNVATNELGKKDQHTGQRGPDETEWSRCVVFGRQAEIAATYLKKGSMVYLEGRLKTNKWTDQNGVDRYSTDVICNEMQLMGGNDNAKPAQQGGYQQAPQARQQPQPKQQPSAPQPAQYGGFDDFEDDKIPFMNPYKFMYDLI